MSKFAKVPLQLIADSRLSKNQLRVMLALFSFHNHKTGKCNPKRKSLEQRLTGMAKTRISQVTSELVGLGWLIKIGKGGFSKSVQYSITVPMLNDYRNSNPLTVTETVTGSGYQNSNPLEGYQNSNPHRTDKNRQEEQVLGNSEIVIGNNDHSESKNQDDKGESFQSSTKWSVGDIVQNLSKSMGV